MPASRVGGIKQSCASDVCLSFAYIGPKSRIERFRKTKIGTEVAHITRDSDTKRSTCRAYCGGLPYSMLILITTHSLFCEMTSI